MSYVLIYCDCYIANNSWTKWFRVELKNFFIFDLSHRIFLFLFCFFEFDTSFTLSTVYELSFLLNCEFLKFLWVCVNYSCVYVVFFCFAREGLASAVFYRSMARRPSLDTQQVSAGTRSAQFLPSLLLRLAPLSAPHKPQPMTKPCVHGYKRSLSLFDSRSRAANI